MALENRTRSGIQGGSVTAKSISFTNNIERFVGRSSNSEGRIAATDVIDFDIDLGEIEEPEKFANAVGYIEPEHLAWYERVGATICVGFTSIVSGVADVVESVVDGGAYLVAGAMSLVGADDAANSVREFIQTSWVDEANKAFYEGTEIGRNINQASVMAYDSDTAMGIRNTSAKVTKFVAETALTMVPGAGPVLAASFGALSAMGEASENVYVTKGIDNVTWGDNAKVLISGVGGAIEGYSAGQMGANIVRNGIPLSSLKVGLQNFDTNAALQSARDTLTSGSTYLRAIGGQGIAVANATVDWVETGEFNGEQWLDIAKNTGKAIVFQTVSSYATGGLSAGYDKFQRDETNRQLDSMSPEERSQAWEDYFKETYGEDNVIHESGVGVEGANGSFIDPTAAAINDALERNYLNNQLNNMSPEDRSQAWEDYFKEAYGEGNVTHESGIGIDGHNGSYVDPDAAAINEALDEEYIKRQKQEITGNTPEGNESLPSQESIDNPHDDGSGEQSVGFMTNKMSESDIIVRRAASHGGIPLDTTPRTPRTVSLGNPPFSVKTDMTEEELIKFYNDFYNPDPPINTLDEYRNWGVPSRAADVEVVNGKYGINWVEENGFAIDENGHAISQPTTLKSGQHMDRYGNPSGCFTGDMPEVDGVPKGASYGERSLPYAEGSQVRTEFEVAPGVEISGRTMTDKVNSLPQGQRDIIIAQMDRDAVQYTLNPDGTVVIPDIQVGDIAPAYGQPGGGTQYQIPIRTGFLEEWGWLIRK